jgi:hypothetical protein
MGYVWGPRIKYYLIGKTSKFGSVSTVKISTGFSCCTPPKDRSDWRESFNFLVFGQSRGRRLSLATAPVWRSADSLAEVLSGSARDRGMSGAQEKLSFVSLDDRRPRFRRPGATSSEPIDQSVPIKDRQ